MFSSHSISFVVHKLQVVSLSNANNADILLLHWNGAIISVNDSKTKSFTPFVVLNPSGYAVQLKT